MAFLAMAALAHGDLIPHASPLGRGDPETGRLIQSLVRKPGSFLGLSLAELLSHAGKYWGELYFDSDRASDTAAGDAGRWALHHFAQSAVPDFVKATDAAASVTRANTGHLPPPGADTNPLAAGAGGWRDPGTRLGRSPPLVAGGEERLARAPVAGASAASGSMRPPDDPSARPDSAPIAAEPWSSAEATPFRAILGLTMLAILIVFWLRDEMKEQAKRELRRFG